MHNLLDLRGNIPINIHITVGKWHDSNELDEIEPEPFAFYIMDKAHVDFSALFRFHKSNAYWISRPKDNMKYDIVDHRLDFDIGEGINGDFTIKLITHKSKKLYPDSIRMVSCRDKETGDNIEFITNNFEIRALEVANLYRHRWDIEVFFKWIKQNITIKNLWGYSKNAVCTHLWVAIIAYLIIAWTKVSYQSSYSVTEVATLIRIAALEKIDLKTLITKPKESIIQNQNIKELSLFDQIL